MKNLILAVILLSVLASCQAGAKKMVSKNDKEADPVSVIQPFEGLEIKANVFSIEATQASTIDLKNGGKIEIPANAFVDSQGKAIKGKVDIEWTEYHTLTDIMLSGIPMKYDSAGVTHDFQSGGMFTIKASQKQKELELAPGKKANINLTSIQDSPCYSFYKIDESNGKWDYITTQEGEKIAPPVSEKKEIPGQEKVLLSTNDKTQLIDAEVDYAKFPELADKDIVAWKTKEKINKQHFMDVAKNTTLKPGESPGTYTLEIQAKKEVYTYTVQPYTLQEAKKASKSISAKIEKDFSQELAFQNDLRTGKILRSIEIESLGTYNWDAILHIPDHVEVLADFTFPDGTKEKSVNLFFVCPELNATIRVPAEAQQNVKFARDKKFNLVGILNDNSIVVANAQDLEKMKQSDANKFLKISFRKTGDKLSRGQDLAKVLVENI